VIRRHIEGPQFVASLHRAGVRARSPQLEAIKETLRAITEAENLPGPLDYEVLIPPVRTAWCRRIPGQNLWLFYRVSDDAVYILLVTRMPPVPVIR
jgi:Txe/YoeB family toxin of Txe-Axe toxin-antitoxin module